MQKLEVVQDAHDTHRDVAHELGSTVRAGFEDSTPVKPAFAKAQNAGIFAEKIEKRDSAADHLAHGACKRRAGKLIALGQKRHQNGVQNHVGQPGGNGDRQPKLRLFCRDKEGLEEQLKNIKRYSEQENPPVQNAVVKQFTLGAEKDGNRPQQRNARRRKENTEDK